MPNTKLLIFDFDGVIVDSFDGSYKIAHAPLGVESKSDFRALFKGNIARTIKSKLSPRAFTAFFNRYKAAIPGMPIVPGISEAIKLISNKYLLAIVSSTTSSSIHNFLKTHRLDKYFTEVLGIDHDGSKEQKICDLLQTYTLTANDCVMITDTAGDIDEAKRAEVKTIGVTWGYHDESTLNSAGCTALAQTPAGLVKSIQKLFTI